MKKYSLFIIFLLFSLMSSAQNYQDSVLLLSGKSYRCNVIGMDGPSLHFQVKDKKGKPEDYYMAEYRIFSFYKNGTEKVLYKKNDELGNFLEPHESRRYAIGGYDARETYHPAYAFWSSLAIGYGFSLWDTYLSEDAINSPSSTIPDYNAGLFGKGPTILPFAVPIVLTASFGLPNMRVRDKYILHKNMVNDQMYYNGFNSYAKQKRAFSALKGSAIGIGLGMLSYAILKIN